MTPETAIARPSHFELAVVAASAGGVVALRTLLAALPLDLPIPVVVVQHRAFHEPDLLLEVLQHETRLPVREALAAGTLESGVVYIAPSNMHLRIGPTHCFELSDGRRILHVLSSADPLFESAARVYGGGVIAIVLTGTGHDATAGVQSVHGHGGIVIVQEPATAAWPSMPNSAIDSGSASHILPLPLIGPALVRLATIGTLESTTFTHPLQGADP
jgi:two-component system chemotaxis response regulator CheB